MTSAPASTAEEIPPKWVDTVRATLNREGVAFRAGSPLHTVEVQSINTGNFHALLLPKGGTTFVSAADRDLILQQLHTQSSHDLTT